MDIVNISIKRGIDGGRREERALGDVSNLRHYAEMRPPMIFLIDIPAIRTGVNPPVIRAGIISNRHFFGVPAFAPIREIPKNGDPPRIECAKMICSAKGESALI